MQQHIVLDNRYELEHKLGEGGMAAVYRGRDRRLNRPVAVKVLHSFYATDPDFLDRFRHEAQAAASLSHPNIVNVYDVGQDGNTHYIVMEYVEGMNLKTLINRDAPLPISQAIVIAEAVANGLAAAHRFGLIHRDIKPQNIMVEPDGHVRITDFGIAKSHLSTARTQTGITFGTADYISPEQARGEPATIRSDIYSLAVTLFEMLAGRLPFYGENAVTVAMQHVTTPPPSLRMLNPQVPAQLEMLVLRTLAKDPHQRPASAQEFAHLLRNYRELVAQETVFQPGLARMQPAREQVPVPPVGVPPASYDSSSTSGRHAMPPARPAVVRAPRQQGPGCGIYVLGMFLLAGVLGLVLLFSSGTFDSLFAGASSNNNRPGTVLAPTDVTATASPTVTATPTVTPTPTPELVAVPDVTGLTRNEAQSVLEQAGFEPVETEPRYNDTVPENRVIEQGVAPNTEVEKGQQVSYTLSLGPRFITVPNLVQRRLESARSEAEALGLNIEVVEEPSRSVSEGFVINQIPNANARIVPGDTVRLVVSVGDKIRMPELTGLGETEARAILRRTEGLNWSYSDLQGRNRLADFERYSPGEVVSMAFPDGRPIQAGDWVPRGSNIVLGVRAEE